MIRKDSLLHDTPVVMISGNEHATEQFYANRIGADDFMKKPFSRFEVFSRIEVLLDSEQTPRRRVVAPPQQTAAAIVAEPPPLAIPPSAELSAAANMLAARKELAAMGCNISIRLNLTKPSSAVINWQFRFSFAVEPSSRQS